MKHYLPIDTFPKGIRAIFSSAHDGSIAAGQGKPDQPEHISARNQLLQDYFRTNGFNRVFVSYKPDNTYTHIERLASDADENIFCDALYTTEPDKVITLPVADCIATVVYDPIARMLGVLHLGRHSSIAGLIEEFAVEVADSVGSDPRDWHVWMSPSIKQESDRMDYFDPPYPDHWKGFTRIGSDGKIHIDTSGHNTARFERLGVKQENIYVSPINTYTDNHYFSQRAADELRDVSRYGRMMVAACMTDKSSLLQ